MIHGIAGTSDAYELEGEWCLENHCDVTNSSGNVLDEGMASMMLQIIKFLMSIFIIILFTSGLLLSLLSGLFIQILTPSTCIHVNLTYVMLASISHLSLQEPNNLTFA